MDPNASAHELLNQESTSSPSMESTSSAKSLDTEDGKSKQDQHISNVPLKKRDAKEIICRWAYECGISFHAFENDNFKLFLEACGQIGPGAQPPTRYELSKTYLTKEVHRTKKLLKTHEDVWKKYGCSIMINSWSDRKTMSIMDFCVNSRSGTVFLSSKESFDVAHTSQNIYEYVEHCIQEVGPENVVQVVTNNESNKMGAAKLLKEKRPTIFWTSCATHTIKLMLEGISDLPMFKKVLDQAKALTLFTYAHHKTLTLMRSFTKKRDIVRPGVTRYSSAFLTLQSLDKKKDELRSMFSSIEWEECADSKTLKGKYAYETVLDTGFWEGVSLFLKVFSPLIKVIQMVDVDRKPSMGFVYGEIMNARQEIIDVLGNCEKDYEPIIDIISSKMKDRLDSYLHLTAYLLNPYYHYKDPHLKHDPEVMEAVLDFFDTLFPGDLDMQKQILMVELPKYKNKKDFFGHGLAVKTCEVNNDMFDPAIWWGTFGDTTPHLRKIAMRILSLTTSSSVWERNRSTLERKRNRLTRTELNNLDFVQFNANLMAKNKKSKQKNTEELLATDASEAQEWLVDGDGDEVEPLRKSCRPRELFEEELEPESEQEVDEVDYGSDEVHNIEEYGEDEDQSII